jgi:CheY-like chemotaxis protein
VSELRVLHVDDEPDIRELVQISLELDPELHLKSCSSGADALSETGAWLPDVILMDVMMPVMDGPQTLIHLREREKTAKTPVVFMTARAQARELTHFLSLGAAGVIPKPFDPMTLAGSLRQYVRPISPKLDALKRRFVERAQEDAGKLAGLRSTIATDAASSQQIVRIAHVLAGSAGIHGFDAIGSAASDLELMAEAAGTDKDGLRNVARAVGRLIEAIERDCNGVVPPSQTPDVRAVVGRS